LIDISTLSIYIASHFSPIRILHARLPVEHLLLLKATTP